MPARIVNDFMTQQEQAFRKAHAGAKSFNKQRAARSLMQDWTMWWFGIFSYNGFKI